MQLPPNNSNVMTKTEEKRLMTKAVIDLLENRFLASNIEDNDGGRMGFSIDDLEREFHRRDYEVIMLDNINLAGEGWTEEELNKRDRAIEMEKLLNRSIEELKLTRAHN